MLDICEKIYGLLKLFVSFVSYKNGTIVCKIVMQTERRYDLNQMRKIMIMAAC